MLWIDVCCSGDDAVCRSHYCSNLLKLRCVCSRQQSRAAGPKSSANGESAYTAGFTDTCRNHGDEYQLKYGEHVSLNAGLRPHAEYHSNVQRRPMDVQHCDHVTSPPCAAANGCAALTEVSRNSYGWNSRVYLPIAISASLCRCSSIGLQRKTLTAAAF